MPAPHETWHIPAEHTCPAGHARPHAPQLARSVCVSRHMPVQLVSPAPHDTTHIPREHTSPVRQALLHAPQWFKSV